MSTPEKTVLEQSSIDTVPILPTPATELNQNFELHAQQLTTEEEPIHAPFFDLPEPPADWEFNNFLTDIAEALSNDDLNKMKNLFSGEGGIGQGVLEKVTTPLELFKRLRNRQYMSRDNLIYLQQCLRQVGRMDLVQKAVEFARSIGDVLHFYPASAEPENGYKYVKFHVEGKDFRNCNRGYLDTFRSKLSRILFTPQEFVIIAGVEPSSSLLITLMLPVEYVRMLQSMLDKEDEFPELLEIGVDIVCIDTKSYNVKGVHDIEIVETDQQAKLVTVYQQLQDKTKLLEDTEIENISLDKQVVELKLKLNAAESKAFQAEEIASTLKVVMKNSPEGTKDAGNKLTDSGEMLKEFGQVLKIIEEKGFDRSITKRLLELNTAIVATGTADFYSHRERKLLEELRGLQAIVVPLQLELQKYQYFTTEDIDKIVLESFQKLIETLSRTVQPVVQYQLTEEALAVLRQISRSLRPKDRQTLEREYQWLQGENLKHHMKRDQSIFLACILHKEIEKQGQLVDPTDFIALCLRKVGREDLLKRFLQLEKERKRKADKAESSHNQHANESNRRQPSMSKPTSTMTTEPGSQQDNDFREIVAKMAEQVQKIHDTMQSSIASYDEQYDPWRQPIFSSETSFFKSRSQSSERPDMTRPRNPSEEQTNTS